MRADPWNTPLTKYRVKILEANYPDANRYQWIECRFVGIGPFKYVGITKGQKRFPRTTHVILKRVKGKKLEILVRTGQFEALIELTPVRKKKKKT